MKKFKRAAACAVTASLMFGLLPASGCSRNTGDTHTPMGTNEVFEEDSPWYNIEKNVVSNGIDSSELEYSWSELLGTAGENIIMYTEGRYPMVDVDWSMPFSYNDYALYQLDIYTFDGELVNSIDLKDLINSSDVFDNIDPEELIAPDYDYGFDGPGVGARIDVSTKADPEDPEDSEDTEETEETDASELPDEEVIDDSIDFEVSDEDLIDPRDNWYIHQTSLSDGNIVVSVYLGVGMGHEYAFIVDSATGDLISVEETGSDESGIAVDGSYEGFYEASGYTIDRYWLYSEGPNDNDSYIFVVSSPDGSKEIIDLREVFPSLSIFDISTFLTLDNNKVLFEMSLDTGTTYGILDLNSMAVSEYTEDTSWLSADLWSVSYVEGVGSVVVDETGLILVDFDNKEQTLLFDFNWCNINRSDITSLSLVSYSEDEVVFAGSVWMGSSYSSNNTQTQIIKLTKADSNPNAGKTVLVAATTGYLDYSLCEAVCRFNEENSDFFITFDTSYAVDNLLDFSEINTEEDYNVAMLGVSSDISNQLAIDLMAGEGPDIILDATGFYQLNNDNYLLDLSDRVPTDGYFANIFEAAKIDGKLYQVPVTFALNGIITSGSNVDDGQVGFTFDQYADFVDDVCNGNDPMNSSTQLEFFVQCFNSMNDQFISDGEVDYDNEAFRALAEYVDENVVDQLPEDEEMFYFDEYNYEESVADFYSYASFSGMIDSFAKYEDATILGIPSIDGRGPLVTVSSSVAISAQTQEVDGCWAFVEMLLSEDIQTIYGENDYCTPVNIDAFDATSQAIVDDYNEYVRRDSIWYTEEEIEMYGFHEIDYSCIDEFKTMIESCSLVASSDSDIITIVREEMPAYFSGQKDLEDVIEILEDRVQTTIDERD